MKRLLILFALSITVITALAAYIVKTAAADADLKDEILKISDQREQALAAGDIAALDRIDADNLVYTNWRGVSLTKAEHLADIKARNLSFQSSFKHNDVQVVVHGNTGIVTGISTSAVDYKGTVSSSPRRFVNVYAKQDGRWLCVAHMETPVTQ